VSNDGSTTYFLTHTSRGAQFSGRAAGYPVGMLTITIESGLWVTMHRADSAVAAAADIRGP
jgi:hypothetical protein